MNPPLSMTRAVPASLLRISSCNALFNAPMSSSMSWGRVGITGDYGNRGWQQWSRRPALALGNELLQEQACDHVQGFRHPVAFMTARGKRRRLLLAIVQQVLHKLHRGHAREIALVILQHVGDVGQVQV